MLLLTFVFYFIHVMECIKSHNHANDHPRKSDLFLQWIFYDHNATTNDQLYFQKFPFPPTHLSFINPDHPLTARRALVTVPLMKPAFCQGLFWHSAVSPNYLPSYCTCLSIKL